MGKCVNCGTDLNEGANFCANCGAKQDVQAEYSAPYVQPEFTQNHDEKRDAEENKVISIVCYLWILFFLPLVVAPNSKFARFHANQALVLFIASALFGVIAGVIPFIGVVIGVAGNAFCVICMILGIINAAKGEKKELPLIGKFQIIK